MDMGNESQRAGGDDKSEKGLCVGSMYAYIYFIYVCTYVLK